MENYFIKLNSIECPTEKKWKLTYVSWSDAWAEVKKLYSDANYKKIKNELYNTYLFRSWTWWSVEVEVSINWITHTADLAITDFKNQDILYENIKSTDIQNTLQRAFAKAIAMHWIWLYVYRWEDLPEQTREFTKQEIEKAIKDIKDWKYTIEAMVNWLKKKGEILSSDSINAIKENL